MIPPRKIDVSLCPGTKSPECSLGGVVLSAPSTPWPGWPPRPPRAHGACEGRGEGRSQGVTVDGRPPPGVAPAAVAGPPAPAGGSGGAAAAAGTEMTATTATRTARVGNPVTTLADVPAKAPKAE